jgi:hypothetical protein
MALARTRRMATRAKMDSLEEVAELGKLINNSQWSTSGRKGDHV